MSHLQTLSRGFSVAAIAFVSFALTAQAADEIMAPAVSGYDVVAYQTENKAVRGSGMFTASHQGETYLFASEANKKLFEANPSKYIPAYNGWCAYGMAMGKKFHADPTVFAVIDGKTYLNLDKGIQEKWNAERAAQIKKAGENWTKVEKTAAAKL